MIGRHRSNAILSVSRAIVSWQFCTEMSAIVGRYGMRYFTRYWLELHQRRLVTSRRPTAAVPFIGAAKKLCKPQ